MSTEKPREWKAYQLQKEWSDNPRWAGVKRTYDASTQALKGSTEEEQFH